MTLFETQHVSSPLPKQSWNNILRYAKVVNTELQKQIITLSERGEEGFVKGESADRLFKLPNM